MAYFTLRDEYRGTPRARWALRTSMVSLSFFSVGIIALLAGNLKIFDCALVGAAFFQLLAGELMFQGFVFTMALLVGPFFFAVYGIHQNRENWRTWQFWIATAACEIVGGLHFNSHHSKILYP
jgi:hypothetical protein